MAIAVKKVSEDPARQALAAAIEKHESAQARAASGAPRRRRFLGIAFHVEAAVEAAEAGLSLVRSDAVDAAAAGREFLSPKAAKETLDDALERLTAIVASEPRVARKAVEAEGAIIMAQGAVHDRIGAVVANSPGVARIVAESEAAQKTRATRRIFELFCHRNMLPDAMKHSASWRDWPTDASLELNGARRSMRLGRGARPARDGAAPELASFLRRRVEPEENSQVSAKYYRNLK